MSGFNKLLFQAEKLSNDLGDTGDLPRIDRNLRQILEASNELYEKVAQGGTQDIQANLLLGSKGIDLPQISQKLDNIISKKAFEVLEPAADCNVNSFLKNETETAILQIIDEFKNRTSNAIQEMRWESIENDWETEKVRLLSSMTGPSEDFLDLDKTSYNITLPEVLSNMSTLTTEEIQYAKELKKYNRIVLENQQKTALIQSFSEIAKGFNNSKLNDMWEIISVMLNVPPLARKDPIENRSQPPGVNYFIKNAKSYLEQRYKRFIITYLSDNNRAAKRGGIPGTYPLVRSFIGLRFSGDYLGLEDGFIDERPLWPMVYYCIRCGDYSAALYCLQQHPSSSQQNFDDLKALIEEISKMRLRQNDINIDDVNKISKYLSSIKFHYGRSVRNTTDPFKRVIYSILGSCDIYDEHSEVIQTIDDYLWLKLNLIAPFDSQTSSTSHSLFLNQDNEHRLTFSQLQTLIVDNYGEKHYQANKQPHVYFQVLALTGQFEAAIEFLSRVELYSTHAVHMAIAINESYFLAVTRDVKSPIISQDPDSSIPRLNFARLIISYAQKFQLTNIDEALHYYFVLRNVNDIDGNNLFGLCIVDLALESHNYELLFGKINRDGVRSKGLVDQFSKSILNTSKVTEMIAERLKDKGLFEDAIKMYDIAENHEEALKLLSTILSQVVTTPQHSTLIRYQSLVQDIEFRYAKESINCSQSVYNTFMILKDLLSFFELYHNGEYTLALEVLEKLQIVPLSTDDVETKVNNFKNLQSEVCRVIPDLLLAIMNILFSRYQICANELNQSQISSISAETKEFIRNQAKAISSFAGSIPYRLPGDTNTRLVQMEILMH